MSKPTKTATKSKPTPRRDRAGQDLAPITFRVPMAPTISNGRGQTRFLAFAKQAYWQVLDGLASRGELPLPPSSLIPLARVAMTFRTVQWNDWGNVHGRAKWTEDWLTERGYWLDDGRDTLPWPPALVQETVGRIAAKLAPFGYVKKTGEPRESPGEKRQTLDYTGILELTITPVEVLPE